MKVLMLITDTGRGGAPTSLGELSVAARDLGINPMVVSLMPPGPVLQDLQQRSIDTHSLRMTSWVDVAPALLRLRGLIQVTKPDVIQTMLWHANVFGRMCSGLGPPVVDCYQSVDEDKPRLRVLVDRWTAPRATAHVCVSGVVAQRARQRERLDPGKITVIHVGKDVDRWVPRGLGADTRDQLGIPHDAPVVGWVGRMHPVKNLVSLVRGVADIPETWLLLVGDGEERDRVSAAALRFGLGNRLVLAGEVEDPAPLFEAMDVFCLPSHWEGSSGALVEAMASGRTVVATAVGGNPEIVTDGVDGILVENTADSVRDGILRGLTHPLGDQALVTARERFSLERMVRQYVEVWQRALISRGGT